MRGVSVRHFLEAAVIAMMLLASGVTTEFTVPDWVIVLCASAITAGTVFGGWRIIKTLGFGLFRVRLIHSIASQVKAAAVKKGWVRNRCRRRARSTMRRSSRPSSSIPSSEITSCSSR